MNIFPAIDMIDGCAVRLYQGDFGQRETFGKDPAVFARKFVEEGSHFLHLVDLDGAKVGKPRNFEVVQRITSISPLFIELGGGIRDEATIEQCFEAGVDRVILGTAALKKPDFTRQMIATYGPDKIAVGVDARDGKVAIEGWLATSETDSFAFCRQMRDMGVRHVIYTDISRDGANRGANLTVYRALTRIEGLKITASGGVSSARDIIALKAMGLYAAVLGKGLYDGTLNLAECIKLAGEQE